MAAIGDRSERREPAVGQQARARGVVAVIWIVIATALAGSAVWQSDLIEQRAIVEAETRAQAGAAAAEQSILRSLDGIRTLLDLMAALGRSRDTEPDVAKGLQAEAERLVGSGRFGTLMAGFIDPRGRMAWSTIGGAQDLDLSMRPYVRAPLDGAEGIVVSEPIQGLLSNRTNVFFTQAVHGPDGRLVGVAAVAADPEALSLGFADLLLRPGDGVGLRRLSDGMLLARSGPGAGTLGPPAPRHPRIVLQAQQAARGTVQMDSRVTGREIFAAYRRIADVPVVAIFTIDRETELRDAAGAIRVTWIAHLALAGAIGAALALAALIRRRRDESRRLHHAETMHGEMDELLGMAPAIIVRATVAADGSFRRHYMSPSVEAVTGWAPSAVDTPAKMRALSEPSDDAFWNRTFRALRQQDDVTVEWRLRRPDGRWMWLRTHARVFQRHPDGSVEFTSYIVDMTRERELSDQAAASAKLATLGELATGLAHELNQPIAVMILAAENALDELEQGREPPPEAVADRLRRIGSQGERAKVIIDHLRLFGHPHNDQAEAVQIPDAVEGTRILTAAALRQSQIRFEMTVAEGLPAVRAQVVRLEQVLVNLLMNARDALMKRPRDVPRRLRLSARAEAECVVIEVADNGGGIAPEILPAIFEPFVTTKAMGLGTGLGLSICDGIIKSFGGTITAANGPDGAIFTVTLPVWTGAQEYGAPPPEAQKSRSA